MNVSLPSGVLIDANGYASRSMRTWLSSSAMLINALVSSGVTGDRPVKFLFAGRTYFDTTLGTPIWYDGSGWVDAAGVSA